MELAFLVSLKLCENFDGSTSEPAMRSCDTGQRIPCFDNISVVRKTDAQAYGQVTTQIYISRMDKETNFVNYEAKLEPPRAPVELR